MLIAGLLALLLPAPIPSVFPVTVPQAVPSPVVAALPSPVQQLLATAPPGTPGGVSPTVPSTAAQSPAPVAGQPATEPAPQPSEGVRPPARLVADAAPAPAAPAVTAPANPPTWVEAVNGAVQSVLDTPLGPTPPVIGVLLLLISAGLAIRRRLRQMRHDRALEHAKMHFLKVASHELRTPLTVIGGYVSMAADGSLGALPEPMRRALPTLHDEVDQLERLVEQMLLSARLDEGLLVLERVRIDLRDVTSGAVHAVSPTERRRLLVELPTEPVTVVGDPGALQLVVRNLIENALKYSPDDRDVRLTLEVGWNRARIAVSDRGIGIRRDDLRILFTRFGRIVNAENSHIFGSGLGLYLSRGIARIHDGDITADSAEGRGSTFTLELPLAVGGVRRLSERFSAPRPEPEARRAGVQ